jgi:predicted nucleic acid-binding Zn ribbon protein
MRRHRLIEDWRGMRESDPVRDRVDSVSSILPQTLQSLGLKERFAAEEVQRAWRPAVGDFIAQHAQPDTLRRGTLVVLVLQPAMRDLLEREHSRTILKKLQEKLGAERVTAIRFRIG